MSEESLPQTVLLASAERVGNLKIPVDSEQKLCYNPFVRKITVLASVGRKLDRFT